MLDHWKTLLLLFAVALVILAAKAASKAHGAVRDKATYRPGRRKPNALGAFAFSVLHAIMASISACLLAASALSFINAYIVNHSLMQLWQVYFGVAVLFFWAGRICQRQANRLRMPTAEERLARDRRSPVLYLRCFAKEEILLEDEDGAIFEEAILSDLNQIGPVVGLHNARLRGRPSNYAAFDWDIIHWRLQVSALLRKARLVVVAVAKTPGVKWEIKKVCELGALRRTIFVLPPYDVSAAGWLLGELGLDSIHDIARSGSGRVLVIVTHPKPHGYLQAKYDEASYSRAISEAVKDLGLQTSRPYRSITGGQKFVLASVLILAVPIHGLLNWETWFKTRANLAEASRTRSGANPSASPISLDGSNIGNSSLDVEICESERTNLMREYQSAIAASKFREAAELLRDCGATTADPSLLQLIDAADAENRMRQSAR